MYLAKLDFLATRSFLGNALTDWAIAGIVLGGVTFGLLFIRLLLNHRLVKVAARTSTLFDDLVVNALGRTKVISLVAAGGLAAFGVLTFSRRTEIICRAILISILLVQAGLWGGSALRELVKQRFEGVDRDGIPRSGGGLVAALGLAALWSTLFIVALDNFGVNVTALVAGLGVGGIAVALAAQNVLGDLFASISILLDKPFVVGDFIIAGDFMGSVERIG
jgi:small-conductance mechanosensitive channel